MSRGLSWMAAVIVVMLFAVALLAPAFARDNGQWKYQSPDVAQYFATLMQPDNPAVSCCGAGDVYYADETETDAAGNLVAIITDTRPDGPLQRAHVPVGTRVIIPPSKIRKHPIPNPTGHSIVFLGAFNEPPTLWCFEPIPLI